MAEAVTGWTDERVELLGKLWGEGLSASQIAALLGGGVTRNAVIGKVHRLGLAGRPKAGQPAPPPRAPAKRPAPSPVQATLRPRPALSESPISPPASAPSPVVTLVQNTEVNIPVSERVSILELRETMCRWPLGDPQSQDFGFCGHRTATGLPYCTAHCRVAYQPASERKRLRA